MRMSQIASAARREKKIYAPTVESTARTGYTIRPKSTPPPVPFARSVSAALQQAERYPPNPRPKYSADVAVCTMRNAAITSKKKRRIQRAGIHFFPKASAADP